MLSCMEYRYFGHANRSGVYRIVNKTNGKFYIGSAKLFKVRARQHLSSLKSGKHHNKPLQASFTKYGEGAFLFEVLEVVDGTVFARKAAEQKYVSRYFSNGKCLNLAQNTIQKIGPWSSNPAKTSKLRSINSKRRWANPEYKQQLRKKISAGKKKQWSNPVFRSKMIQAVRNACAKQVIQMDTSGNVINTFSSVKEAGEKIGINYKNISAVCHNQRKSAGGYFWKLIEK